MRMSQGRSGRPFDSRQGRSVTPCCRKACSVRSSASWWLPTRVGVGLDVARVVAERSHRRRRRARLVRAHAGMEARASQPLHPRVPLEGELPASRGTPRTFGLRSPAIHSPGVISPADRLRNQSGGRDARAHHRLGDQGHGVQSLGGLADDRGDLQWRCPSEQLVSAAVSAAGGEDRGGEVADGKPGPRRSRASPSPRRSRGTRARPRPWRCPRRSCHGARPRRRRRLRSWRRSHLDAGDVVGALADQAGLVEDLSELAAQVGVGAAQHERRGSGHGLPRVRGAPKAGDRARSHPLAHVLGGQGAHRRHQALAQHQDG